MEESPAITQIKKPVLKLVTGLSKTQSPLTEKHKTVSLVISQRCQEENAPVLLTGPKGHHAEELFLQAEFANIR
jgi:hypothetical protein